VKKSLIGFLSALLFLSGCVRPGWFTVKGPFTMSSQNYEVMLPEGWRRYQPANPVLVTTRDGTSLQEIRIAGFEVGGKKTPFTHTKKKVQEGMLPQELAEVLLNDLQSNPKYLNFQVQENSPAKVDGHPGFKLVYNYQTASELTEKEETYGFILGKWYYLINYNAPARHYFDQDLATFEKVKDSFRLMKD